MSNQNQEIMKMISIFILLSLAISSFGQEVTIYGDAQDEGIQKRKTSLEAKGFEVKVVPADEKDSEENMHPFIKKWSNSELPSFSLTSLDGQKIESETLKGKNVHINFWSITCKPCIEEFAELNQLKEQYDDWVFLAIAPENAKKVNKVLQNHPLNYHVVANAKEFFRELGIDGYPKNFFVDKKGVIQKVTDGTNYKAEFVDGKMKMIPDNYKVYDGIMSSMPQ